MKITKIKICGLSEVEHVEAAGEADAEFIGLMFAPSTRRITPEKARQLAEVAHNLEKPPAVVGVFANTPADGRPSRLATDERTAFGSKRSPSISEVFKASSIKTSARACCCTSKPSSRICDKREPC